MKARIMTHMVAGFPAAADPLKVAGALAEGGAAYLEIQFPFSDPQADGPAIQAACTEALARGFTVDSGFALVRSVTAKYPGLPVFVMTYASLAFSRGIAEFCRDAKASGATGVIVPDLVPGADEGLFAAAARAGIACVPVIVPSVSSGRVDEILSLRPEWLYVAVRSGITGIKSSVTEEMKEFLFSLDRPGLKVLAGFGIRERPQVEALSGSCHALVVGSALVDVARKAAPGGEGAVVEALKSATAELVGA